MVRRVVLPLALFGPLVLVIVLPLACGSFSADEPAAGDAGTASADASDATDDGTDGTINETRDATQEGADDGGIVSGPVVLADNLSFLSGVTATETAVYFVEQGTGNVHTVPLDGSATEHSIGPTPTAKNPRSIALAHDQYLYWCNVFPATIAAVQADGSGFISAVSTGFDGQRMIGLAPLPNGVAAVGVDDTNSGLSTVFFFRAGANIPQVVSTSFHNVASVATRDGEVYFSAGSEGTIVQLSATSPTTQVSFASIENDPGSVAVDAANVYWARYSDGLIRTRIGSASAVSIAMGQVHPYSLATDGTNVYWMTEDAHLRRAPPMENATVTDVQSGFMSLTVSGANAALIRGLALTKNYVVWLTGDGKVMRAPK